MLPQAPKRYTVRDEIMFQTETEKRQFIKETIGLLILAVAAAFIAVVVFAL
jgi:hypothetical protein